MKNKKLLLILALIGVAAGSRLLPHPPNFTALGAMAIFGGAVLNSNKLRYFLTFGALVVSDLILNNTLYYSGEFSFYYPGMLWVYASFGILVLIGSRMKSNSVKQVVGSGVIGSVAFFLLTNFGYWMSGILYPTDMAGLLACYVAALPFFGNTLVSTLLFSGVLFGSFHLVSTKVLSTVKA
ncbi:MAG: hypothetical protein KDC83_02930 [Flavobacteriales bacterium]|nr:hypothetical protein [Flavobacteriales bacterium]